MDLTNVFLVTTQELDLSEIIACDRDGELIRKDDAMYDLQSIVVHKGEYGSGKRFQIRFLHRTSALSLHYDTVNLVLMQAIIIRTSDQKFEQITGTGLTTRLLHELTWPMFLRMHMVVMMVVCARNDPGILGLVKLQTHDSGFSSGQYLPWSDCSGEQR
jgi:hypothetical protein